MLPNAKVLGGSFSKEGKAVELIKLSVSVCSVVAHQGDDTKANHKCHR